MLLTGNYQTDRNVLKNLANSWPNLTIGQVLKKHLRVKKMKRKKYSKNKNIFCNTSVLEKNKLKDLANG